MITNLIVAALRWIGLMKTEERINDEWALEVPPSQTTMDRAWRLALAFQTLEVEMLGTGNTMEYDVADYLAWVIDLWIEDQDQMTVNGELLHCEEQVKEANGRLYHKTWIEACADMGLENRPEGYMVVVDPSHPLK